MRKDEYKNIFTHQQSFWWYIGMTKVLSSLLSQYVDKNKNITILDAGCGTGAAFSFLRPFGKVVGVDVSPEALRFARKVGEKTKKASVLKLPFPKRTFDVVVSLDVLYHAWVGDYHKALAEYARVLKDGGILLWREPAYDWLKSGHDLVDYTQKRFTAPLMKESVETFPFEIKKMTYVSSILFPLVLIKRLPVLLNMEKREAKSDIGAIPDWLNTLLAKIFSLESYIVRYLSFPFGSSVVCIAKKV